MILFLFLAVAHAAHAQTPAPSAPRHAILIGNAHYTGIPALRNPLNDVRSLAAVLAELDFEIHLLEDATLEDKQEFLAETKRALPAGATVFFYYAGHALQVNGLNWLIPTDFALPENHDIATATIGIDEILEMLDEVGAKLKILVLDACRDYPLGDVDDVFGDGLAGIAATGETLIAYATTAGSVALDGNGPNSPFAGALASALSQDGLDLYDIFRSVRSQVREATQGRQLPWVSGSIENRVVLRRPSEPVAVPASEENLEPVQAVHWRAISKSVDPNDFLQFASVHFGTRASEDAIRRASLLVQEGRTALPRVELDIQQPQGNAAVVTACDVWVSHPDDPYRVAPAVPFGLVNTREAIRDCSIALSEDPDNPRLNFLLGRALDVAAQFDDARHFYERASELGYPIADFTLGSLYRTGFGVERDLSRAAELWMMAAEQGLQVAQVGMARLYRRGWGVRQSYPDMLRWLEHLEAQNYPQALDVLGNLYRQGIFVEQDLARAFEFYRRASVQGYANATSNLAGMYRDGLGVEADWNKAVEMYQQASEQGNPFAPYHLAALLVDPPDGGQGDAETARALLEMSLDRGYPWAAVRLANYLRRGLLGSPDPFEAAHFLHVARAAGEAMDTSNGERLRAEASDLLAYVEAELSPQESARANARARAWLETNGVLGFVNIYRN